MLSLTPRWLLYCTAGQSGGFRTPIRPQPAAETWRHWTPEWQQQRSEVRLILTGWSNAPEQSPYRARYVHSGGIYKSKISEYTHSYMHTNRNVLLNSGVHASYLLSDIVIDNNVSDLVQQLCQWGDGCGCCCDIFHAPTPHETVQLPISYSCAAAWCHQEAGWRGGRLHTQQQPDRKQCRGVKLRLLENQ